MLNIPNSITLTRIALIPVLVAFAADGFFEPGWGLPLTFGLISLSDLLDGEIARRTNQISELGKLLDPIADKILVLAGLLILLEYQGDWGANAELAVPGWSVLLIMAREFSISGLRSLAGAKGMVLAASKLGKMKTAMTMLAIGGLFFRGPDPITGLPFHYMGFYMYWIALAVTLYSGVEYFWKNRALFSQLDH
jgi:CDP-diacylglycerol--glycerol-3-phosphate 3-phosphatidyltransferase